MKKVVKEGIKILNTNKKAYYNYDILDKVEAGVVLQGSEIKSARRGNISLSDSFIKVRNNEAFLVNSYIAPYEESSLFNHEPKKIRKLLLHKKEILKLSAKVKERGFTLVPLKVYLKKSLLKVQIALVRGKRDYEKSKAKKERQEKRAIERSYKRMLY